MVDRNFGASLDQVGGQHEIVSGVEILQVARVRLEELHPIALLIQSELRRTSLHERHQLPFFEPRVLDVALLPHLHSDADDVGGGVQAGNVLEAAGQLEAGAPHGTSQVERLLPRPILHELQT
jgi:hypothetical protein